MSIVLSRTQREVLEAVVQMPEEEYSVFVCLAAARRAKLPSQTKAQREAELLRLIKTRPARAARARFQALHRASLERALSRKERRELDSLVDALENHATERVRHVTELAGLRGSTFRQMWNELGLGKKMPLHA